MKQIVSRCLGRCAYIAVWPILFVYLKFGERTRIIVTQGNHILLVKGWINDGKWSLPGGGLHRGEEPKKGALRELKEETGIVSHQILLFGKATARNRGLQFKYYRFYVVIADKTAIKKQQLEIAEAAWIDMKDLTPKMMQSDAWETWQAWKRLSVSDTIE